MLTAGGKPRHLLTTKWENPMTEDIMNNIERMPDGITDGPLYEEPSYPEPNEPDPDEMRDDLLDTLRDIASTGLGEGFYRKRQAD